MRTWQLRAHHPVNVFWRAQLVLGSERQRRVHVWQPTLLKLGDDDVGHHLAQHVVSQQHFHQKSS